MADAIARVRELQGAAALAADPAALRPDAAEAFRRELAFRAHHLLDPDGDGGAGSPQPLATTAPPPGWAATVLPPAGYAGTALGAAPGFGAGAGAAVLAAAESQVGAAEEPPGSNDGPQLALYRSAVAGAAPGQPWCAYFASWAAAQAGVPLGPDGAGLGAVADIAAWAASSGRLLPPEATPAPGDLVLYGDRHVGIVEAVEPDGSLRTVEGNYANAVSRVHRARAEATGFVRL